MGSDSNGSRQAVLVELFTSEGCSSCPPADALLAKLDRDQPVPGAEIIALSEHVDYWNYIGWNDPYSSPAFSARQQQYAKRFRTTGPYTPQMVVDGTVEFVGSDSAKAGSAIQAAARRLKLSIRIRPSSNGKVTIESDPLPRGAHLYLAIAMDSASSDVVRGENKGRRLHHVAIAQNLRRLGANEREIQIEKDESGSRLIVFAQESGPGKVLGAALYRIPTP